MMVLNEAPCENNQHTWYSRLALEGRKLSAYGEGALVNIPLEEKSCLDNQSQQASVTGVGKKHNVFPPRLSLQSRSLPGNPHRMGTGLINTQSNAARYTNVWTRFIHLLRALFTLFLVRSSVETLPALPTVGHECVSMSSRSTQGRQRLAGRTTRVCLETVSAPSSVTIPKEEKKYLGHENLPCTPFPTVEKVTRRPAGDCAFMDDGGETTCVRLAAIEKATKRREGLSPARSAGSGRFECGQRDVAISDPSVTASSVVLVTLTTNPGPVVVQYVSLQPQIGFTLHLTAPTTMGAPFNYVVL